MLVGYMRVSTSDERQSVDLQRDALVGAGVDEQCDLVDLDGPIFLKQDRVPGVRYAEGTVWCGAEVWGGGA